LANLRDPKVSRRAAKDAAERLRLLTLLLKDEDTLTHILAEADKTIRDTKTTTAPPDDTSEGRRPHGSRRCLYN